MNAKRIISVFLIQMFVFSFTCFADSVRHDDQNTYFKCKHTQQKIERTKNCPCGCNKNKKSMLRVSSAEENCESDDVVAHAPQFEKLVASNLAHEVIRGLNLAMAYHPWPSYHITSLSISPPIPPV